LLSCPGFLFLCVGVGGGVCVYTHAKRPTQTHTHTHTSAKIRAQKIRNPGEQKRERKSAKFKSQKRAQKRKPEGVRPERESAKTKKSMPSSGYTNTFIALKSEG
jgi:hypothetical protein